MAEAEAEAEAEAKGQAMTTSSTSSLLQQQTLHEGSLVKIYGLQSDQGKKLNGGYGILVNAEPFDNGRYAVKVFATLKDNNTDNEEEEEEEESGDKSEDPMLLYNHVKGFVWLYGNDKETTKQLKPDNFNVSKDFRVGMAYAFNAMRRIRLQQHVPATPAEVCHFVNTFLREVERVDPNYFRPAADDESSEQLHGHDGSASDAITHAFMVMLFFEQNKVHLDKAFEYVLWMKRYGPAADFPPESVPWEKRYVMGLDMLASTTNELLRQGNGFHPEHDTHTHVMVEVAKARLEMCPEGSLEATKYLGILGEAESLAGNHLEGAKLLRRALALAAESTEGSLDDNTLSSFKGNLVNAQLHCPGMMLEDYHVVQNFGSSVQAVRLSEKHMFRLNMVDGKSTGVTVVGRPQLFVMKIPTDHDDPVFDPIMPLIS